MVGHRREPDAPEYDRSDAGPGRESGAAKDEHLVVPDPVRLDELGPRRGIAVDLDYPSSETWPPPAG